MEFHKTHLQTEDKENINNNNNNNNTPKKPRANLLPWR
jgi:hypothetical protein